jgi:hypothetical protein
VKVGEWLKSSPPESGGEFVEYSPRPRVNSDPFTNLRELKFNQTLDKTMKPWLGVAFIFLAGILPGTGYAAPDGPAVVNVDQKISIRADDITLANLMRLWDQATGMHSTVPPALVYKTLSVRFSGLDMDVALERIFQGQSFGYIRTGNQVLVSANAPPGSIAEPEADVPSPDRDVPEVDSSEAEPPPQPVLPPARQKPAPRPTYIPTPFGPIITPQNSPGNPPFVQLPPVQSPAAPPFFVPQYPVIPPAGAPNGPLDNPLFGPLPVYENPILPPQR